VKFIHFCILFLLSSCAVYRQQFDCPPDPGVPCTSVTDLEQMIAETESGPDLFFNHAVAQCTVFQKKRVWINEHQTPDGCWVPGHYVYID
jgi:hypothetical protein